MKEGDVVVGEAVPGFELRDGLRREGGIAPDDGPPGLLRGVAL